MRHVSFDFSGAEGLEISANCVVVNLTETTPPALARQVINSGGWFLETSASPGYLDEKTQALQGADGPGTAILGVGVVPGLTNLMAVDITAKASDTVQIDIGIEMEWAAATGLPRPKGSWALPESLTPWLLMTDCARPRQVAPGQFKREFAFGEGGPLRQSIGYGFVGHTMIAKAVDPHLKTVRSFVALSPAWMTRALGLLLSLGLGPAIGKNSRVLTTWLLRTHAFGLARLRLVVEGLNDAGRLTGHMHLATGDQADVTAAVILATVQSALAHRDPFPKRVSRITDHLGFDTALAKVQRVLPGTWVTDSFGRRIADQSADGRGNWLSKIRRLGVICWTLLREFRALRSHDPLSDGDTRATDFVRALIGLGPTFVKLGQILSTRPDILPATYIAELEQLQEHAPPVPFDVIRATVETELGSAVADHFATFDPKPVAFAPMAQVHRATLADNTAVAVKVQRPDMDTLISRDLDALGLGIAPLAKIAPRKLRRSNLRAFLAEFRRYTLNELDFAKEARTMERFRQNFNGHNAVTIPQTHPKMITRRLLTIDRVEGMRLGEAVATHTGDKKDKLVSGLVDVLLKIFVSDGLFHADLHTGNTVIHADGRFKLLDFGIYGQLTAAQQDRFFLYWIAIVQSQTRRVFHHFRAQTEALPGADEAAFLKGSKDWRIRSIPRHYAKRVWPRSIWI